LIVCAVLVLRLFHTVQVGGETTATGVYNFLQCNWQSSYKYAFVCAELVGYYDLSLHMFIYFVCRVNCSFYFKIGACRHGERCSRLHNKPTFSQVRLILQHVLYYMYASFGLCPWVLSAYLRPTQLIKFKYIAGEFLEYLVKMGGGLFLYNSVMHVHYHQELIIVEDYY